MKAITLTILIVISFTFINYCRYETGDVEKSKFVDIINYGVNSIGIGTLIFRPDYPGRGAIDNYINKKMNLHDSEFSSFMINWMNQRYLEPDETNYSKLLEQPEVIMKSLVISNPSNGLTWLMENYDNFSCFGRDRIVSSIFNIRDCASIYRIYYTLLKDKTLISLRRSNRPTDQWRVCDTAYNTLVLLFSPLWREYSDVKSRNFRIPANCPFTSEVRGIAFADRDAAIENGIEWMNKNWEAIRTQCSTFYDIKGLDKVEELINKENDARNIETKLNSDKK